MSDGLFSAVAEAEPEAEESAAVPNLPETVPAAVLADLLGVSGKTVRELAVRGIVVRASRGEYALRASVRGYAAHLRGVATGRAGGEAVAASAAAARARLVVTSVLPPSACCWESRYRPPESRTWRRGPR